MPKSSDRLIYSLANEDTSVELGHSGKFSNFFVVCGSGARVLPLFQSAPKSVKIVDTNPAQLAYCRFKFEVFKQLDRNSVAELLGYAEASPATRQKLIESLKLSAGSVQFLKTLGGRHLERGFIFLGSWESFLLRLSQWIRLVMGVNFTPLFEADSLDEQRRIFLEIWPRQRLSLLLKVLVNGSAFNFFHYKGRMKKNQDMAASMLQRFQSFFWNKLARDSFFMQLLFLGKMPFEDSWPLEMSEVTLAAVKGFTGEVEFLHGNLLELWDKGDCDFFSLSDVVSYLDQQEMKTLQGRIFHQLKNRKAMIVSRSFGGPAPFSRELEPFRNLQAEVMANHVDRSVVYDFDIFSS